MRDHSKQENWTDVMTIRVGTFVHGYRQEYMYREVTKLYMYMYYVYVHVQLYVKVWLSKLHFNMKFCYVSYACKLNS